MRTKHPKPLYFSNPNDTRYRHDTLSRLEVDVNRCTGRKRSNSRACLAKVGGDLGAADTRTVQVLEGDGERVDTRQGVLAGDGGASGVRCDRYGGVVGGVACGDVRGEILYDE